jgi:carbon starvation protein
MQQKFTAVMAGGDIFAPAVQLILAVVLFALAIVLAVKGAKVIFGKKKTA